MIAYKSQIPQVYLARENTDYPKWKISSSKDIFKYIQDNTIYDGTITIQEEIWAMYLNRASNLIGISRISIGDDVGVVCNIKKIFAIGVLLIASNIIVFHNHPSGSLIPSEADKKLCEKIKQAGMIMDVKLTDFIIVTGTEYCSFVDEGELA